MGSPLDLLLVLGLFAAALGFLVWRFGFAKKPPSCAPGEKLPPQVIVGARLAKGLARLGGGSGDREVGKSGSAKSDAAAEKGPR